jgi:hypothetical protein
MSDTNCRTAARRLARICPRAARNAAQSILLSSDALAAHADGKKLPPDHPYRDRTVCRAPLAHCGDTDLRIPWFVWNVLIRA